MKTEIVSEIRKRLRRYRKVSNLNQRDFAIRANLGTSTIKDLLACPDHEFNPTLMTLANFLEASGKTFCDLFSFTCGDTRDVGDLQDIIARTKEDKFLRIQFESMLAMIRHSDKHGDK